MVSVLWFNLSWKISPMHPLCFLHQWDGEENQRSEKTHELSKDSSIGKAKTTHTSKAHQGSHSSLPMGRQVFSRPQKSRAPSCRVVTLEDHHSEYPPLPPSRSFYAEHDAVWYGIYHRSVGVSCPACVPSQLLAHPQPPRWRSSRRSRKGLETV